MKRCTHQPKVWSHTVIQRCHFQKSFKPISECTRFCSMVEIKVPFGSITGCHNNTSMINEVSWK